MNRIEPCVAKKFERSFTKELEIIRLMDGQTLEITEFAKFRTRIESVDVSFRAAVLDDLFADVFLGYNFLVELQIA